MRCGFCEPERCRVTEKDPSHQEQAEPPLHDVIALTGGGSVARLVHRGEVYVLRITRMGRLILTK